MFEKKKKNLIKLYDDLKNRGWTNVEFFNFFI